MAVQSSRDPTDTNPQGGGSVHRCSSNAARLVERTVLDTVESALELPLDERSAFLEKCPSLDDESRARAVKLLAVCERIERADAARTAADGGADAPEPEFLAIDLATLLAAEDEAACQQLRLANGARLGPYRIERFIAAGGMGEVYEAVDSRIGRRVAIKTLPVAGRSERAQRFMREAMLMARLEHTAIARMYEWGSSNEADRTPPFIVMEFVEGRPLREAAASLRIGPDGPHAIVRLLLPVVDAVAHAHARGVLHRDIKPGNILVDASGMPRLLEFGVAALIESDAQATLTLTEGAAPGTLTYMSPEHVRGGSARVTTRSDVYGLGLVLYEMLAGRPAVEAGNRGNVEVIDAVVRIDPRPLRDLVPGIETDLEFVVRKALCKDPSARYASADALAEDLRRVLAGQAPIGHDAGTLETLRGIVRRNGRGIAIASVVLLGVGVVTAFGAVQFVRAREAEARAEVIVGQLLEGSKPLITDLHRRLLSDNQPLAARRAALEATVGYLEWVLRNSGQDERVLLEVALRYCELARIAGSTGDNSLGDTAAASEYYLRALAIFDRLLETRDGHTDGGPLAPEIEKQVLLERSSALRSYAGLLDYDQRAALFARANEDQRRALALMPDGEERVKAERYLLFTEIQRARLASDLMGFATPLAGLRRIASMPAEARNPEVFSEIGLGERYFADVLEEAGRFSEAVEHARLATEALAHSIGLGQDEFTNRRHLARVEILIASRTCADRPAGISMDMLVAALERSRGATSLKPTNSFYRNSHLESLVLFAIAARVVADHARNAGDVDGAASVVTRGLLAIDEHLAFTLALPTEEAPHRGEPKRLADLAEAREALSELGAARP